MGEEIPDPIVVRQQSDSALMAHVQLENIVMPEARQLQFKVDHVPLASTLGQYAVYALIETERRKTLVLTANLEQSDLPLRTAFPILVTNAMSWFQGQKGELREAFSTGSVVDVELPDYDRLPRTEAGGDSLVTVSGDTVMLELQAPNGRARPLPTNMTRMSLGPLDQCGIWQVVRTPANATQSAAIVDQFACNLASHEESDLRPRYASTPDDPQTVASIGSGRSIWFYTVTVALVFSALEWFLYQRRWIS